MVAPLRKSKKFHLEVALGAAASSESETETPLQTIPRGFGTTGPVVAPWPLSESGGGFAGFCDMIR